MTWYTTADARADAERIGRREHRRLAPTPEQSYWLRAADTREVACEDVPASVLAFLISQRLVRVSGARGVDVLEVSATGRMALMSGDN